MTQSADDLDTLRTATISESRIPDELGGNEDNGPKHNPHAENQLQWRMGRVG